MYNELYNDTFATLEHLIAILRTYITQLTVMCDVMYDVNVWMVCHAIHYSTPPLVTTIMKKSVESRAYGTYVVII